MSRGSRASAPKTRGRTLCDISRIRQELIRLCGSRRTRRVPRSKEIPCRWFPYQTVDPNTGRPFTEAGAWEYVAQNLGAGCEITLVTLRKPKDKKGYVMKLPGAKDRALIYVKLQIGSGVVYGRSFHDSEPSTDEMDEG